MKRKATPPPPRPIDPVKPVRCRAPNLEPKRRFRDTTDDAAVEQAVLGDGERHVGLQLAERPFHHDRGRGFGLGPEETVRAAFPANIASPLRKVSHLRHASTRG